MRKQLPLFWAWAIPPYVPRIVAVETDPASIRAVSCKVSSYAAFVTCDMRPFQPQIWIVPGRMGIWQIVTREYQQCPVKQGQN